MDAIIKKKDKEIVLVNRREEVIILYLYPIICHPRITY